MLDFFTEKPELTLPELIKLTGLPKPTVHRLLSSLEACGFLVKVKQSNYDVKYRMGLKLLELGSYVKEQLDYRKIALPHMEKLNKELGEGVHLTVLDGFEAVYIEKVESDRDVRLYNRVGRRSPLHVGSGPKVLFAFLSEEQILEALETMEFKRFTENTITGKGDLKIELKKIRSQGYALSWSEQNPEAIGLSFPIMDHSGQVVASVGISTFAARFMQHGLEVIREKTKEAAENVSKDLGYKFSI